MDEKATKDSGRIYEVGFHVAPIVGEEGLAHEVSAIKALLEKASAAIVSEDFPRLRTLAYPLSKVIKGTKHTFKECFFGWVKFESDPEKVESITREIDKMENIVRFIAVKTVRENTLYGSKFAQKERMSPKKEEGGEKEIEEKKEVNVEEVDKAIEDLVVE